METPSGLRMVTRLASRAQNPKGPANVSNRIPGTMTGNRGRIQDGVATDSPAEGEMKGRAEDQVMGVFSTQTETKLSASSKNFANCCQWQFSTKAGAPQDSSGQDA